MKDIRWGLLSTAKINRRLIPAIRASKRGKLVAVASRNLESAQSCAAEWDIPHAFGDYTALLESGKIDVIYIGLPNHLHAEWSIRAMKAGVHVLCEKPLAVSGQEVRAIIQASQQYQRVIAEAFMYHHHPQTRNVSDWVRSGRLGEIITTYGVFTYSLGDRLNIRLIPEFGGGSLWDVGVYPVSYAQYIMGVTPEWVAGAQWIGDTGVDETFSGVMSYPGSKLANFSCGFRSPFYTYFEIVGTHGRLTLTRPFAGMDEGRCLIYHPEKGEPIDISVPETELYRGEVEDLHSAILDEKPTSLSLEKSLNHIRTVEALYQSARSRQVVHLSEIE